MFSPNFYGGRCNKAMHGYDSKLNSQLGFFASLNSPSGENLPTSSQGVFHYLKSKLELK